LKYARSTIPKYYDAPTNNATPSFITHEFKYSSPSRKELGSTASGKANASSNKRITPFKKVQEERVIIDDSINERVVTISEHNVDAEH